MPLHAGTSLGPYHVLAPIGAGGMGEVYRARDTRLDRDVAIKILPPVFSQDAERLARFEREAKTLASLNHPNIAQIYGVEPHEGGRALVMELVEGEDLAQRISRGRLPVAEAVAVARQIADALDAAHERGIIHRDLKPANVKVSGDATVKVLDFGLAKAVDPSAGSNADLMNSPTITSPATQLGMILGTAAYMAPEQAKGRPVDKRADIWAFGCVLYEMLTARRAFAGSDVSETLASVLARDVDWSALPKETPAPVVALLRACLQKDKKDRLRDIGDARLYFDDAGRSAPSAAPRRAPILPWAVAALAVIAAAAIGAGSRRTAPPVPMHMSIALPPGALLTGGPLISRDGRRIAFALMSPGQRSKLYVRDIDASQLRELPGTEDANRPFMSPDGRRIGYFASGRLYTLDLEGGAPTHLAAAPANGGATWGDDGTIVFLPTWNGGLYRIDPANPEPTLLIAPDPAKKEYAYSGPHFLPGSREIIFSTWGARFSIDRLDLRSLERHTVALNYWGAPTYAASGHLLVPDNGDLLAMPYPPIAATTPVAVLSKVHWHGGSGDGVMKFAVSESGTAVFSPGDVTQRTLVIVDDRGHAVPATADRRAYVSATVSSDGRRAAVSSGRIDIIDLERGTRIPLSQSSGAQKSEVWSTDRSQVFFSTNVDGNWEIYAAAPGSTDAPKAVLRREYDQHPLSVAADGTLLFMEQTPGKGRDLWMLDAGGAATPWLITPADELDAVFSPDASLVAYTSNASGRQEVYMQPRDRSTPAVRVSTNGGYTARWSPAGDRIFFRQDNLMMVARLDRAASGRVAQPEVLFDGGWELAPGASFSVMPDGKRFLMVRLEPESLPTKLDVIVNWFEELRRRVPRK